MDPEHESIRKQMRSDFHAMMIGLATQRDALMNAINPINISLVSLSGSVAALNAAVAMLTKTVTEMGMAIQTFKVDTSKAFEQQAEILKDYMERTDESLALLLESKDGQDNRLDRLEARVEALENRIA